MIDLLFALAAAPLPEGYEPITSRVAADRVARCVSGPVTLRSDAQLDEDVIVAANDGPISDEQIVCIDNAASFYDVELPPDAQPRFDVVKKARLTAFAVVENRKWLAAHNLLDRLPRYNPATGDDAAYAEKIERLCKAKGALHSQYGPHAISPDWIGTDNRRRDEPLSCLMHVSWGAGFEIGFIGNEQAAPEP